MSERIIDDALCCPAPGQETSSPFQVLEGPEADEELAKLTKALGHPARVRIIRMLSRKEARVCSQIVDAVAVGAIHRFRALAHSQGSGVGAQHSGRPSGWLLHQLRHTPEAEGVNRDHLTVPPDIVVRRTQGARRMTACPRRRDDQPTRISDPAGIPGLHGCALWDAEATSDAARAGKKLPVITRRPPSLSISGFSRGSVAVRKEAYMDKARRGSLRLAERPRGAGRPRGVGKTGIVQSSMLPNALGGEVNGSEQSTFVFS